MERADYERLRWRCSRRAFLELDLALTRFLENGFGHLDEGEQRAFAELADREDHEVWQWISGQAECADPRFAPLIARLRKG